MMDRNELLIINSKVEGLTSNSLKKNIKGLIKTLETSQKLGWTVASYINEIFMEDVFGDDFETDKELAEWLGISTTMVAMYKTAVAFVVAHEELSDFVTVDRAYRLGVLENKGEYYNFLSWLEAKQIDIKSLSDGKLKKLISEYNKAMEDTDALSEEEEAEEAEGTEEEAEKPIEYAVVTYRGAKYQIPVDVLESYKVEED